MVWIRRTDHWSAAAEIGTLGLRLMMKFNVTYDYFRQQVYFEPNSHFKAPYKREGINE